MADIDIKLAVEGASAAQADMNKLAASIDNMTDQLTKAIGAWGKTEESTKKASKSMFTFGDALKMAGVNLGLDTLVQGVKDLASSAFTAAKDYETLSISMGVLLKDAAKVPGVLAEWKKFSDATPFEPEQVNKAGKSLLAFGFESSQVIGLMEEIGNVSAAVGKDFNELTTIYGKARVAGTLYAEDINQLTEAGVPIMEKLGQVMGVSADKVKKMGSEGKITFPVFQKAFAMLGGEGGEFGGMMDKLSQSSEGLLSTMKGELNTALREAGQKFLPQIVKAMGALLPVATSAISIMGGLAGGVLSFAGTLADSPAILLSMAGALAAYNASTIAATASTIGLKIATIAGNIATAATAAFTRASAAAQAIYIASTNAMTGATTLATAAQRILNVVMASNPLGLAILAATALGAAYLALRDNTVKLTKEQEFQADVNKKVNDAFAAESANASVLFARLEKLNPKSEEAKTIRDEINTTYKTYLPNQLTESSNLDAIKKAQQGVNEALLAKIKLQVREQELTRIYTKQQSIMLSSSDALTKATGANSAAIQKAISVVQESMAKVSEDKRLDILQSAIDEDRVDALTSELVKISGAGKDVQATIAQINAKGLSIDFLDAALGVAMTEDEIRQLSDILANEAIPNTKGLGEAIKDVGGKAIPAKGSIAALEAELGRLNTLFNNAATQGERTLLMIQIKAVTDAIADAERGFKLFNDEAVKLKNVTSIMSDMDAMASSTLRPIEDYATAASTALQGLETGWEKIRMIMGDEGMAELKKGLDSLKNAFRQFGAQAAESIGYALGKGASSADAFKEALIGLLVEVPKLAGMALLNAAAFPANAAISLPLTIAGLGLLGLSGIIKGFSERPNLAAEATTTSASAMTATDTAQAGIAGLSIENSMVGATIMINVDGSEFGGVVTNVLNEKDRLKGK